MNVEYIEVMVGLFNLKVQTIVLPFYTLMLGVSSFPLVGNRFSVCLTLFLL